MKPVSTAYDACSVSTRTVLVWPPAYPLASKTTISCSRWSRWAATRPDTPAPMIAMRMPLIDAPDGPLDHRPCVRLAPPRTRRQARSPVRLRGGSMLSMPPTIVLRPARDEEARAVRRLAYVDSQRPLKGDVMVAEVGSELVAAMSLRDGRLVA